jgi:hypothetical protein
MGFGGRTSRANSGKIRVFIYEVKRTVATLLPSLKNAARAFSWRYRELQLVGEDINPLIQ